jgi:hypothetical protein
MATLALLLAGTGPTDGQVLPTQRVQSATPPRLLSGPGADPVATSKRPSPSKPWPVRVVGATSFSFSPVVLGRTTFALGLEQVSQVEYSPQRLEELDLATGRVKGGAEVPAGSSVVVFRGHAYVIDPHKLGGSGGARGPYVLRSVQTGVLSLGPAVPVLGPCAMCYELVSAFQPVGPHAGDLWLAGGTALMLVEPATGRVVETLRPKDADIIVGLAVEPDGRYIDLSTRSLAKDHSGVPEVLELDTATGALVKRFLTPFAVTSPDMVSVPGGLWLSWRGGMAGTAKFFPEGSLAASPYRASDHSLLGPPFPGADTMMGDDVTRVGDIVVLSNNVGATCVTNAGKVLASAVFGHSPWSPFGGSGRTLYAIASSQPGSLGAFVVDVTMPSFCRQV